MTYSSSVSFADHTSTSSESALTKGLSKILRADQISVRWPDRLSYGRDCNSKGILWVRDEKVPYPPQWVLWPETTQEVAKILTFANEHAIPIIPFGGGSGVCGGTWALKGGIALDLKRMDQVLDCDTQTMRVRVQAGINGEVFERELNRRGATLGHFPSSIYAATVGGYVACRSAGQFSSLYGKIEDMVEDMEVVLADGKVVSLPSPRQGDLDLRELFLGSEGTLGVVTETTLKIHAQPETEVFLGFYFSNLAKGLEAVREVMQRGLRPAVVRLYDPLDSLLATSYKKEGQEPTALAKILQALHPTLKAVKDFSLKMALKSPQWLQKVTDFLPAQCLLILGFQGSSSVVEQQRAYAEKICQSFHAKSVGEGPGRYWLKHRYSVSYKLSPLFDQGLFADTMETATSWSNLTNLYDKVREAIGKRALVLAHFSHAYPEGCSIYFTFVGYAPAGESSRRAYDQIWKDALDACVQAGGTISHHHGVGLLKASHMRQEWGDAFEWLCRVKQKLDPNNIMNPGKLGFGC